MNFYWMFKHKYFKNGGAKPPLLLS